VEFTHKTFKIMALKITNLKEFNKELKAAMKNTTEGSRKVLVKVSNDAFGDLQDRTPKETSRAAAGWNVSVGKRPSEWKPSKGNKNYPLTPFGGENKIKYNSIVNISNNVEYIIPLDEGHSQQATGGTSNIVNFVMSRILVKMKSLVNKESKRVIK
jgi:hypothetical protein